jgi:hypothetical protein
MYDIEKAVVRKLREVAACRSMMVTFFSGRVKRDDDDEHHQPKLYGWKAFWDIANLG